MVGTLVATSLINIKPRYGTPTPILLPLGRLASITIDGASTRYWTWRIEIKQGASMSLDLVPSSYTSRLKSLPKCLPDKLSQKGKPLTRCGGNLGVLSFSSVIWCHAIKSRFLKVNRN